MSRHLGIDIGHSAVRVALLRTSYRRIALEGLHAWELVAGADTTVDMAEAVRIAVAPFVGLYDSVAVALDGAQVFSRRFEIPLIAQKQLASVVPFEIEAQIPFDLAEAVFDFRALTRAKGDDKVPVIAVIARQDDVRARIEFVRAAMGHEPEVVVPGSFALAQLEPIVADLGSPGPVLLVDLGALQTEVVLLCAGEPVFGRTLSTGTHGLPGSQAVLARELRQTLSAWRALGGTAPELGYLVGGGASLGGAEGFLAAELGLPMQALPALRLDGITLEQANEVGRFAKAIGLALSLPTRSKALNLRRGVLVFERGYGFLRDKIPMLAGLGAVIVVSFLFATWAEMRALSKEREVLESGLALVTKDVFGEEIREASRAMELVEQGSNVSDEDPLPRVDGFDVLVQLAQAVPGDTKHDLDELDVARAGPQAMPHVALHGVVPTVQDAENLAVSLKAYRCFQDVKIVKTSQQIGGDGQKYHMEFDIKCPDNKKKAPSASESSAAAPALSAKGAK